MRARAREKKKKIRVRVSVKANEGTKEEQSISPFRRLPNYKSEKKKIKKKTDCVQSKI